MKQNRGRPGARRVILLGDIMHFRTSLFGHDLFRASAGRFLAEEGNEDTGRLELPRTQWTHRLRYFPMGPETMTVPLCNATSESVSQSREPQGESTGKASVIAGNQMELLHLNIFVR
jgi:hypothetical protein